MSENDALLGERRSQLQGMPPETQVCSVSGNSNKGETADGPSDVLATLQHDEYSEQSIPPEIQTIRLVVDFTTDCASGSSETSDGPSVCQVIPATPAHARQGFKF